MDIKYEATKALFWNIGTLVDLLSVKSFWRISASKYLPLNPKGDLFPQATRLNQNLPSDKNGLQVRLSHRCRENTSMPQHAQHYQKIRRSRGLFCECMRVEVIIKVLNRPYHREDVTGKLGRVKDPERGSPSCRNSSVTLGPWMEPLCHCGLGQTICVYGQPSRTVHLPPPRFNTKRNRLWEHSEAANTMFYKTAFFM